MILIFSSELSVLLRLHNFLPFLIIQTPSISFFSFSLTLFSVLISHSQLNRGCKLSNWSSWGPCTAACGIGERMRVRVPIEKHSTANEHQRQIMKLFAKFNAQHRRNEISRDDVDIILDNINTDDVENNGAKMANDEILEARELASLSDHEILGVAKPNHPCFNEILVEKQTCGMRQKPCEHEIYGIPRKL